MFESKITSDYHEMNAPVFENYFARLLEVIPQDSVIVMDNTSYHSRLSESLPTTNWRKGDIHNWLSSKNIIFDRSFVKAELLALARLHKPHYIRRVIDEMAKNCGSTVYVRHRTTVNLITFKNVSNR